MTFNVIASRVYISIHALLAESDGLTAPANVQRRKFLSTLSLRRATCGLRLHDGRCAISIHALLAESDGWQMTRWNGWNEFLSTLSLRRATRREARESIGTLHFYPRSPCGERPWQRGSRITYVEFLSTLSLRRATQKFACIAWQSAISIHALLAESDVSIIELIECGLVFLSTLSLRRATRQNYECFKWIKFLSTLSLRRATGTKKFKMPVPAYFYPRSPCGERRVTVLGVQHRTGISIHALLAESDKPTLILAEDSC